MPRDNSGNYSLPAGNPVVTGTLIEANWANPTMSDLGQGLSDSLDRQGRGGMLAPLRVTDGTAVAPGIGFTSQTGSGLYRDPGTDTWQLLWAGSPRVIIGANAIEAQRDLIISSSAGAATLEFRAGTGTADNKRVRQSLADDDYRVQFVADDGITTRDAVTVDAATSNATFAGEVRGLGLYDTGNRVYSAAFPPPGGLPTGDPDQMVGSIMPWSGDITNIETRGWLVCDGAQYLQAAWPELYAELEASGFPFGGGAGVFNVPDIRAQVIGGTGQKGGTGTNRTLGEQTGAETHQLTVAEMPSHAHDLLKGDAGAASGQRAGNWDGVGTPSQQSGNVIAAGGNVPHNNMQPTLFVHWIIKAASSPVSIGESNVSTTPATVGPNEADINMPKSGISLPKRKLIGGANITLSQDTDSITITGAAAGGGSKWTVASEGVDLPAGAQSRTSLNFAGNGVSVSDNSGQDRIDVSIQNANGANVGGGAGVFRDTTGADPATANFRTLVSGDASVSITQGADTLDLRATGAGGGEANTQTNIGAGIELGLAKNGVDLPLRTLDTGQFELNGNQVRIPAGTFDSGGAAATVQSNLDAHTGNTSIHFPVSSLPGAGLVQNVSALDVGQGDGILVAADTVAVDTTVARVTQNNNFTDSQTVGSTLTATQRLSVRALSQADMTVYVESATAGQRAFGFRSAGPSLEVQNLNDSLAPVGSPTQTWHRDGGVVVGVATGGSQGANSLNASQLFEDGQRVYSPLNPPPAGAAGYDTVQNTGVGVVQQSTLNFDATLTASDDAANSRTNITIAQGGVDFSRMQDIAASALVGRFSPTTGAPQEVTAASLPPISVPAAGDQIIAYDASNSNQLSRIDVGALLGGTLTTVRQNTGADISTGRSRLNFIEGSNITLTIADDPGDDEVDITITSTAAGGGGGDMLSPASMATGELYQSVDASGVQTAGTGFLASDVARLSQANTYTQPQTIQVDGAFASLALDNVSPAGAAAIDIKSGNAPANENRFQLIASAGALTVLATDDVGNPLATMWSADHGGGFAYGSPTGGTPTTLGHLNAVSLQVDGSEVYHPGNPPTAADVTNAADVTAANIFTDTQIIAASIPQVNLLVQNTGTGAAAVDLLPGSGTADNRRFEIIADAGSLVLRSLTDAPANAGDTMTLDHAGGVAIGTPTGGTPTTPGHLNAAALLVNNVAVLDQAAGDARYIQPGVSEDVTVGYPFGTLPANAGATVTPDFAVYAFRATTAGALTVDLASLTVEGQCVIYIEGATGVSFINGTPELGNTLDPATGNRRLYLERAGSVIYANFAPSG